MTELETQKTEFRPNSQAKLQAKIMRKIARRERRVLMVKTSSFGVIFVGSSALLWEAYLNLATALTQSGFTSFAALFFSDFNAAMSNFQDYAFSILESFPVFSAAFVVGGLIVVIWSASNLIQDIDIIRNGSINGHERLLQTT